MKCKRTPKRWQRSPKWPAATRDELLERRLDNVVHRLGFGLSRPAARQLVAHGHVTINGKRVNVPSYLVRVGDVVLNLDYRNGQSGTPVRMTVRRGETKIPITFSPAGTAKPGRIYDRVAGIRDDQC